MVIWRILDGKPGHENQSAGLAQALRALTAVVEHRLVAPPAWRVLAQRLLGRFPWGADLPRPDLILGAGHATHLPMLAARRRYGGRAVVLMKPSLPLSQFDLCIVPAHDEPPQADNVLVTRGVLNRIRPGAAKDPRTGLMLIGGPSRHHSWSTTAVIEQIRTILEQTPQQRWVLTTSRRTPAGFVEALRKATDAERLEIVPVEATGADWVPEQLAWAGTVWVTADSVSMIYESLTAGAAVGLLEVQAIARDRIVLGVEKLLAENLLTGFSAWQSGRELTLPKQPFNEAARCAREIMQRWFNDA